METKKLLMIAFAIAITFTQEQILVFLPNIQFTVLLMFVFASVFTYKEMFIYVLGYVLIDSLYMGGFNLFYMVPMLLSWMTITVIYQVFLKQSDNIYFKASLAFVFGFIYGWMFIPFHMMQTGIDQFLPYLIADLPFELVMASTGFLTVLWGYNPLVRVLKISLNQPVPITVK
ncbi:MAG: hypothetical protein K9L26_00490 [Candidatus Izimaplasma sp.]|nr:hypothetical protein [Candidatus Izimaplasma bacterium]